MSATSSNIAIEFRSADNQPDRLPALVADLICQPVAVIVGNTESALAAKAATTTIPIVFATGSDPVRDGLVSSLNRPGGNVTGVSFFSGVVGTKRLELLRQIVPRATIVAMLVNPNTPETEAERIDVQAAAQTIGQQLVIFDVSSERDIETAFATFIQRGAGALLVGTGGFLNSKRERIVALAVDANLTVGIGYAGSVAHQTAGHDPLALAIARAGRILKGERPADLPVMQSTKLDLVINLKTARALGLNVPPTLLATADEVIE